MTNEIQLLRLKATQNLISTPIGMLNEVFVEGAKEKIDLLISEGVKRGIPFQRIGEAVKFNFWK